MQEIMTEIGPVKAVTKTANIYSDAWICLLKVM
jgi:hypothetical protein